MNYFNKESHGMSGKHGYQESNLSKSMRGAAEGPATGTLVVIDEDPTTLEKSERTVACDRGELRIRMLAAIASGSPIVKARDAVLADTGRIRRVVWEALGMADAAPEPMAKAEEKPDLRKAATALGELAERMRRGEEGI